MVTWCARFRLAGGLAGSLALASTLGACSSPGMGAKSGSPTRIADRSADAGDFETAAAFYQQAFDANPKSVEALVGLGRSYAGMGQYARAEQALMEAKARHPNDPAVLLELARTQIGAGKAEAALANLDIAAKKRPRDLQILTARGIALDRLSRHAEAQQVYRNGLSLDPTNFVLSSNLGLSLGLSGRTSEAIVILQELAHDGAATANTRGNLALVYGLAGRDQEAKAVLAVDLPPDGVRNNIAYYHELRAMMQKGRPIGNLQPPAAKPVPELAAVAEPVALVPDPALAAAAAKAREETAVASALPLLDDGGFTAAAGIAPRTVTAPAAAVTTDAGPR